jgi:tail sheath stabilizer
MFGQQYYFGTIRKYLSYFGCVFNNIYIDRTLNDGSLGARIKVPIMLSPKEQVLVRLREDPRIDRPAQIVLPSMAFEMTGMTYNTARKLPSVNKITTKSSDRNRVKYQYVPVPYDITFNLYILVKNAEDGTKIVEQILPMFTPDFSATLELIPEMGIRQDTPIILNTVEPFNAFKDESYKDHRAYIWTLSFTIQGYIYGPVKQNPIIKFSTATFLGGDTAGAPPFAQVFQTPGLTPDDQPTTDPTQSVNPYEIWIDDDWGYASSASNLIPYTGRSTSISIVSGAGSSIGVGIMAATAQSNGSSIVSGVGSSIGAIAQSNGTSTVSGIGFSITAATAQSNGSSIVSGVGQDIDGVIASSNGSSTVSGTGSTAGGNNNGVMDFSIATGDNTGLLTLLED